MEHSPPQRLATPDEQKIFKSLYVAHSRRTHLFIRPPRLPIRVIRDSQKGKPQNVIRLWYAAF
jgi:hypothetical protein